MEKGFEPAKPSRGPLKRPRALRVRKDAEAGLRHWKEEGYDGQLTRNVAYTAKENEELLRAFRDFVSERGLNEDEFRERLMDVRLKSKSWVRIATLANLEKRSVQSMSKRLRRLLAGEHGKWKKDETEQLTEEVLLSTQIGNKPPWKEIGARIGATAEQCRDKWKIICGGGKRGRWNSTEVWALRQGICELTNHLAPVSLIPWKRVRHWVPHRTQNQCMLQWYNGVLPRLLQYQSKHGYPIETEVFERLIVRNLKKSGYADVEDVNWKLMNSWWSASLTKNRWKLLLYRVPGELRLDSGSFEDIVLWLYKALECRKNKRLDRRVLKHAELVLDAKARSMPVESDEEDGADVLEQQEHAQEGLLEE